MGMHTPASLLAGILNELMALGMSPERDAESWRSEVQQLIEQARPRSNYFLDRERRYRDMDYAADAILAGASVVYTRNWSEEEGPVVYLPYSREGGEDALPPKEFDPAFFKAWREATGKTPTPPVDGSLYMVIDRNSPRLEGTGEGE